MSAKIVAYARVSTARQGSSGLGLEAQQSAIDLYARQMNGTVICTYVEIESGKRSDRPELAKAIAHAKRAKAILVVAKLDRLARNVAFTSRLMESGVEFIACDNPTANRLTIHILAAVAEAEAKAISERTRAALGAAKARGKALGSNRAGHWDGREEARLAGALKGSKIGSLATLAAAKEAYSDLLPILQQLRADGLTLRGMADKMNADGYTTRQGSPFSPVTVKRILDRAG